MSEMSTAEQLVKFYDELVEGGISPDTAENMTRDAAARIIQAHGLSVKTDK